MKIRVLAFFYLTILLTGCLSQKSSDSFSSLVEVSAEKFECEYHDSKFLRSGNYYEYLGERMGKVYLYKSAKGVIVGGWTHEVLYTVKGGLRSDVKEQIDQEGKRYDGSKGY